MGYDTWGALAFGLVVGWVTYRTIRRSPVSGLSDIAAVIGAVGGGAVTKLFREGTELFGAYGIGLAIGFFLYFAASLVIASKTTGLSGVNEWLGEEPRTRADGSAPPQRNDIPPFPVRPAGD